MKKGIFDLLFGLLIMCTFLFLVGTLVCALATLALLLRADEIFGCPINQIPMWYRVIISVWGSMGWLALCYAIGAGSRKGI